MSLWCRRSHPVLIPAAHQAGDPSPSPITLRDRFQPYVTFKVPSSGSWHDSALAHNEISMLTESKPDYIKELQGKLSQKRLVTNPSEAVGAHGFCVPLSNETPS